MTENKPPAPPALGDYKDSLKDKIVDLYASLRYGPGLKPYTKRNHLVVAYLEGAISADIVYASRVKFLALRRLKQIEKSSFKGGTGIFYHYQKNTCF